MQSVYTARRTIVFDGSLIPIVGFFLNATGVHFTSYALTPVNYFEDRECWQTFLLETFADLRVS